MGFSPQSYPPVSNDYLTSFVVLAHETGNHLNFSPSHYSMRGFPGDYIRRSEPSGVHEPFLTNGVVENRSLKRTSLTLSLVKWALQTLMWVIFIIWLVLIFFFPSESLHWIYSSLINRTEHTIFKVTGSTFLLFSGPVLIIAILAYVYKILFPSEDYEKKKFPSFRLWTFPVLVDGPFGVVSAAELIGILLFTVYILWSLSVYAMQTQNTIAMYPWFSNKGALMLDRMGLHLGSLGLFCLVFLFLPIARGSVFLRVIDIPFEHATRYHVWLGHLTMMIFTLHGLCYMVSWTMLDCFIEKMLEWKSIGVSNLAGVISLLAGLFMWVTSFHPVRKGYFELFFYTHQLYVVFIIFLAMHVGDFIFAIAAGGIFLFTLDRFLRFCQSRTVVNVISASCLPCGTVEVVLSKPKSLQYNALSFVFLQVRELSWLQWHPFSVSSSPLDGENHISVLIKVLGEWTEKLRDLICYTPENHQKNENSQPRRITASVEGPYGHELAYHLMYENLILVAGGIGISPFLAILSDIFHRVEDRKSCLPKTILVVWAVKKSKELSLLSSVDVSLSQSFSDKLHLNIQAFVTQESDSSLEEGIFDKVRNCPTIPMTGGSNMSSLVGTGNNIFAGAYFAVSTVGFIVLYGLLLVSYLDPYDASWWVRGLLFNLSMVGGVVIFGGIVVFLWGLWERRGSVSNKYALGCEKHQLVPHKEPRLHAEASKVNLTSYLTTQYGHRPDFQAIFSSFSQHVGHADVGVMVCGPSTLQSSVAKECRTQNTRGRWNGPIFHFNSHSFDL